VNDVTESRTANLVNLLDGLWRLLASPRLTVILLVWVAVILALSTVVPQTPPNIEDPVVLSQWKAKFPFAIRPVVERLQPFGVFDLLESVWLRLPLALLLAHALVVLADLGPAVWHYVRGSPDGEYPLGRTFPIERHMAIPVDESGQQLIGWLREAGYRILPAQTQGGDASAQDKMDFFAWHWRWSWLGLAGIYIGLGLASVGLILQSWLGQVQDVNLGLDNAITLPATGAPSLVLEGVQDTRGDPMRPTSGVALVRMESEGRESRLRAWRLHSGRLLRGVWLTLADLRPMAEVTAVDTVTGEQVLLQPFSPRMSPQERVRVPLVGDSETRFIAVPSQNVTLHVDYQADAQYPPSIWETFERGRVKSEDRQPGPSLFLSIYRGVEVDPSLSTSLNSNETVEFRGVQYLIAFDYDDYDATLRLNSALWWAAVALGWGIAALSIIQLAIVPPVYVRGGVAAVEEGSQLSLVVNTVGDERVIAESFERVLPSTPEH
jgi:hypothetical protein